MDGMDGMLSQEEINALLSGMGSDDSSAEEASTGEIQEELTADEIDAIGEISNISMGTAATALFSLVNNKVVITAPVVSYVRWEDIVGSYTRPCVFIQIYYDEGLDGNNVLILKEEDVKIIADLMMGGDGSGITGELTDLHLSAISEAMNQMMGSAATSVSSMLEKKVNISPPLAHVVNFDDQVEGKNIADFLKGSFVQVSFNMQIGDLVDSVLMQLYPFDFARDLYREFSEVNSFAQSKTQDMINNQPVAQQQAPVQQAPVQQAPMQQAPVQQAPVQQAPVQQASMQQAMQMPLAQDVNAQAAEFMPFSPSESLTMQPENIELLMDVPLEVVGELGRTSKSIKEILDFTPGTIIELNRLAGEPIDVIVNGKPVAKGEVVVIEEAFGIRITDIIKN